MNGLTKLYLFLHPIGLIYPASLKFLLIDVHRGVIHIEPHATIPEGKAWLCDCTEDWTRYG